MKNTENLTMDPEDIADRIIYDLGLYGEDNDKEIFDNLSSALEWIKAAAENEMNDNSFRTLYTVLGQIAENIEDDMPWWDKE